MLIGLGIAYRLGGGGGDLKLSNGGKSQRNGTIFMGKVGPPRYQQSCKIVKEFEAEI